MRITYEESIKKVKSVGCLPLYTSEDWIGVVKNKNKIKYYFLDKNNHKFYREYDAVVNGNKVLCNDCVKENIHTKQKMQIKEFTDYILEFKNDKKINILTTYEHYKNNRQKLKCSCDICNGVFYESISNIKKKSNHGCMTIPSGERIVLEFLENNAIKYNYQVYLDSIGLYSDFEIFLENDDIIHLEINGDQHYDFPNQFHRTIDEFNKAKNRDLLKDSYYAIKGFVNIHIRYNVGGKKNEDILLILHEILKGKYGILKRKEKNNDFNISELSLISPKNKKVIAYDLNGSFFKIFNSMLEASEKLNIDNACISDCIIGRRNIKRAGNYIFKLYTDNYKTNIEPYKQHSSKSIIIMKDNVVIEEIKTLNATAKKYNIAQSVLSRYLNNKSKLPLNFKYDFKFKE